MLRAVSWDDSKALLVWEGSLRRRSRRWKLGQVSARMLRDGVTPARTLRLNLLISKQEDAFLSCFPHKAVKNHPWERKKQNKNQQFTQHMLVIANDLLLMEGLWFSQSRAGRNWGLQDRK